MPNSKISIRPIITTIQPSSVTSIEFFQNQTLRPIIKLQHAIVISLFRNILIQKKRNFTELDNSVKKEFITNEIRKNIPLRNQLLGSILGMFTEDEFIRYTTFKSDIDRRVINICIERLHNSLEQLN
ncbi:MAG: glyoxalase [Crocinitomicaceae bacterium]